MRGERTRGFTCLELLVTIGVGGVLILLLMPALQDARAAARRASCIDNLKQMGLALFNYQSAWNVLPMSQVRGEGHGNGHSVFTIILPYLNEAPVYNAYNFSLENWHAANTSVVQAQISTFLCPDNPQLDDVEVSELKLEGVDSRSTFAKSHYGANWGGGRDRWGQDFAAKKGTYTGVMMTVILPEGQQNGPDGKPKARNVGLKDITDGTSTTLALGEKHDSFGWAVGGPGGSEFDVYTQPNYAENDALARKVYSGSVHRQGVHALFCDGTVRRLEPKIDRALWYAMATRAGGERVLLDAPGLSPVLTAGKDVPLETRERLDRASANVQKLVDCLRKNPPAATKSQNPMNLFAFELATGQVTLVASEPDPGLDTCGSPSWTQDGRRILFDAQPRNHLEKTRLKAIDLAGDRWAIRDLGPGNCPTPSPAGDRVIFLQNQDQVPGAETGIWIMGADGTDRHHLGSYGRPRWSADGHQFLVISFSDPCEVTLIDDRPAKKSGPVNVPGYKIYSIPSWADDRTIVAVVGDENSTSGNAIALVDVSNLYRPSIKQVLWTKGNGLNLGIVEPVYLPTGRCLFIGSDPGEMGLYILDPGKPGPPRRLEPDAHDKLIRDLAPSPDGRYLLFSSSRAALTK